MLFVGLQDIIMDSQTQLSCNSTLF